MLSVYIATKNSPSGNPRRGWIVFDDNGVAKSFVDEEYLGSDALKQAGFGMIPFTWDRITVTPAEYLSWKRKYQGKPIRNRGRRTKRTSRRNKRTSRRAR